MSFDLVIYVYVGVRTVCFGPNPRIPSCNGAHRRDNKTHVESGRICVGACGQTRGKRVWLKIASQHNQVGGSAIVN